MEINEGKKCDINFTKLKKLENEFKKIDDMSYEKCIETLKTFAKKYNITNERVRQIERHTLKKVKEALKV